MLFGHGERTDRAGYQNIQIKKISNTQRTQSAYSQTCLGLFLAHSLPPEETPACVAPTVTNGFPTEARPSLLKTEAQKA